MNFKKLFYLLVLITLTACTLPVDEAPPPTALTTVTPQPALTLPATFTPDPTPTYSPTPTLAINEIRTPVQFYDFCADNRGYILIEELIQAITQENGTAFEKLVSPAIGVDIRYYRNDKVVNYTLDTASIFQDTAEVDWGISFGSGQPTVGMFREIVLPSLQKVFTPASLIVCGQLQIGNASYFPEWPYPDMNFYSIYFPGTDEFGGMDWQTWAVGMDHITGKPYLAALVHYVWEP